MPERKLIFFQSALQKALLVTGFFCWSQHLFSQVPGYDITFNQVFDNREYFSDYAFPQTIFGAGLDASLSFDLDSIHGFYTGCSYFYEHGSSILAISPQLILYYQYTGQYLKMAFGSFSRNGRVSMPGIFLNDTLNYYRSNIEGASIFYDNSWGTVNGFIDWTGRVSEDTRETFLVGVDSKLKFGGVFLQATFLMYHNARSYSILDSVPLQDNGILSSLIGYELGDKQDPFSLSISSGIISSYNRFRPQDFDWRRGMISNIKMRYTFFGLNGVYYYGNPIVFEYGDPFYRSGNYGRVDFYIDPFKNPNIESKIAWNLHFVPGEGMHHSQQVLISVTF